MIEYRTKIGLAFVTFGLLLSARNLDAQVTGLAGWDLYIDPGHSRTENMGIFGYSEAEKNLRVGLHLRDLLLTKTDIDTVFNSRFTDQDLVSLSQRTDEANAFAASWFHSIHSDAGPPQANSTLMLWGQLRNGQEKTPPGGQEMSDFMVDVLTRGMRTDSRGSIGDCTFYNCTFNGPYLSVNRNSTMPSELSEAGFHTNPTQNQLNMNAFWPRLEAYSFFWSILDFHGLERPVVRICTGIIFDVEAERPVNGARIRLGGQEFVTDTFASLFNRFSNNPEQLRNGFYFLEDLPNGSLQMIVDAEGFYSDTSTVTLSDTFFTFKDVNLISSKPPLVMNSIPEQGATAFPIDDEIVLSFSRRMNRSSVESALAISPEVALSLNWENGDRRLRIQPDRLETATEYTLSISASAVDLFDHQFDGNADGIGGDPFVLTFTSAAEDVTPPQIVDAFPATGASQVENPPILNFAFDEALDPSSITDDAVLLERAGDRAAVSGSLRHYVVNERSVLNFFPEQELDFGTEYLSRVRPGLRDQFGNENAAEHTFSFVTEATSYSVMKIDDFESNVTTNWWAPQQSGSTGGIISEATARGTSSQFRNLLSASQSSMQLSYGWDLNAGSWLIREFLSGGAPRDVHFDDSYKLQMYVFGDGSGNRIRFALDDRVPAAAASNHEVSQWFTIDWIGWRLIEWHLANDPAGSWLGDGTLHGTLRIDSIQLTHTPGAAEFGTLYFDDLRLVRALPVSVADQPEITPRSFELFQNYPNPFNPETTIRFSLAEKKHVRLVVYDILGRSVRILVNEPKSAGEFVIQWDGQDDQGRPVASGTYVYQYTAGAFRESRKMTLLR